MPKPSSRRVGRWGLLAALIAAATLALAACGSTSGTAANGSDLTQVKVDTLQSAADFPLFFAQEKGYFKKNGLDVKLVPVQNTSDIPALMASGGIDFALTQPGAGTFNAALQGVHDPILMATSIFGPNTKLPGLLVSKELVDSGAVTTAADLEGRKVAIIAPLTSSQYYASQAVSAAGGDPSKVKFVTLGAPDMIPALSNGAVDAAWMFEPLASKAISSGVAKLLVPAGKVGVNFPTWLQARDQFVKGHPEDVTAFVKSLLEGMKDYRQMLDSGDRVGIIKILAKDTTQTDPASWNGVELPVASPDGTVNAAAVGGFESYLEHAGAVKKHVALSSLIDTTYLERATKDLN